MAGDDTAVWIALSAFLCLFLLGAAVFWAIDQAWPTVRQWARDRDNRGPLRRARHRARRLHAVERSWGVDR